MADNRRTLFELHTHGDVQIGPAGLPGLGPLYGETEEDESEDESGGRSKLVPIVLGVAVLAVAAVAVRKYRSDDSVDVPLAESDEISEVADVGGADE